MRNVQLVALATATAMAISGCAVTKRDWGSCTVTGAVLGGLAGGIAGGVTVNNLSDDPSNGKRAGAIAGGAAGGALIGGLLGHLICDPLKETPVAQAAPPPPPPPPPAGTEIGKLRGTRFEFDRHRITREGEAELAGALATMRAHPEIQVRCEGHTDSIGSDAYNQALGQRRADAVRDYLIAQGIDPSRLSAVSYGESRPVADNSTDEGRAENRRVDLIVE